MRKLISIPIIMLLLFSGMSIKFATHYCGGSIAATNISLTGKFASCGMERHASDNSPEKKFRDNCCNDNLSVYSIPSNYYPSAYFISTPALLVNYQLIPELSIPVYEDMLINITYENLRPPGIYSQYNLSLSALGNFRI